MISVRISGELALTYLMRVTPVAIFNMLHSIAEEDDPPLIKKLRFGMVKEMVDDHSNTIQQISEEGKRVRIYLDEQAQAWGKQQETLMHRMQALESEVRRKGGSAALVHVTFGTSHQMYVTTPL